MITIKGDGPTPAKVMVIGDFPGVDDEKRATPYSGQTGEELTRMLHESGFIRAEIYVTYLCKFRPYMSHLKYIYTKVKKESLGIPNCRVIDGFYCHPDMLESAALIHEEIALVNPDLIITLGELPMWYLTGESGITKWRGSILGLKPAILPTVQMGMGECTTAANGAENAPIPCEFAPFPPPANPRKIIPTFSPSQIMKVWEWRAFAVRDLQRAKFESAFPEIRTPDFKMKIRPTFREAMNALQILIQRANGSPTPIPVSSDIETIARHIACVGFAWSSLDAICIPIMLHGDHYFPLEEELEIVLKIREVLTHPNIEIIGQNWTYDTQHFVRHWGFRPNMSFDTMLAQHVCFPGIPKDLGFLASMYCSHYVYWKDELTDYHKMPDDIEKFWLYNAKDCINTWEIAMVEKGLIAHLNLQPQFDFLMRLNRHVTTMMIRGVRIDRKIKDQLGLELLTVMAERQDALNFLVGSEINIGSPKQMQDLFYSEMGFKPILHKKTKQPTADDGALQTIAHREPILRPLIDLISETRSIGVFLSTFVQMPLDTDKRMRSSFNVGGTETFRFSSSKDAFGSGGNLQNIPKGDEDKAHDEHAFVLPNIRKLFIPDPTIQFAEYDFDRRGFSTSKVITYHGVTLFDVDLAGADAQVVAWEAHDDDLKAKFRSGAKIHALNAIDIYGGDAGPDGKREPYYKKAKMGCHLSNYGGRPATLSKALGMTMHESEAFQKRWFSAHPGIKDWHRRVEDSLIHTRSVSNKFGFRRFYFERMENLLPQALAWIPQSTVALVINNALCKISESATPLELLLQVHDSLVGQFPTSLIQVLMPILQDCLTVTIPYDDPLTIGTSLDLSTRSWGDLESRKWSEFTGGII